MDIFWKAAGGVLISVVLGLTLGKQAKDLELILTITTCCMICFLVLYYLEPILEFIMALDSIGGLQNGMLTVLLKSVGIGFIAEFVGRVCSDSGNTSLGKAIHLLGSTVILYLSLPIMKTMMEMIRKILGEL